MSAQAPYPPQQAPQGTAAVSPPNEGKAIVALVLAIASFVTSLGLLLSVPGLIVANSATKKILASNGALGGLGLAKAAKIISIVNIVLAVLFGILLAIAFSNAEFREAFIGGYQEGYEAGSSR